MPWWRWKEVEFTPFQPHVAKAGAARTSPGRSHKRVVVVKLVVVVVVVIVVVVVVVVEEEEDE